MLSMETQTITIILRTFGQWESFDAVVTSWGEEPQTFDCPGEPGGWAVGRLTRKDGAVVDVAELTEDESVYLDEVVGEWFENNSHL